MEPFIGMIVQFGGDFAPKGWAFCDGQLLPIAQNTALFSILGTTYGGNGTTTFALPDLRGRVAIHPGQGPGLSRYTLGQHAGQETVTLTINNMPNHNHDINVSGSPGTINKPGNTILAGSPSADNIYSTANPDATLSPNAVAKTGGNQPVSVIQPYACVNWIIALEGLFPSRG